MKERRTLTVAPVENAPKILADARERLGKLLTHPKRFRALHGTTLLRTRDARKVEPRRPPRLQAVDLVGQAFLHFADVQSWRIGAPDKRGHFFPPGEKKLLEATGLTRTRQRRAIASGKAAGYWTFHQARHRYQKADGSEGHSADFAIYRLTDKFWSELQLLKRIQRQRELAAERARQERERKTAGPLLAARENLEKFRKRAAGDRRPPARQHDPDAEARRMADLLIRLRRLHEDWPPDRVRAEARRLLKQS